MQHPERKRNPELPDPFHPDRRCFGDMKENDEFRRFYYRSQDKVYKEFMLYVIGRNINKYHRFLHEKIEKFEGKTGTKVA